MRKKAKVDAVRGQRRPKAKAKGRRSSPEPKKPVKKTPKGKALPKKALPKKTAPKKASSKRAEPKKTLKKEAPKKAATKKPIAWGSLKPGTKAKAAVKRAKRIVRKAEKVEQKTKHQPWSTLTPGTKAKQAVKRAWRQKQARAHQELERQKELVSPGRAPRLIKRARELVEALRFKGKADALIDRLNAGQVSQEGAEQLLNAWRAEASEKISVATKKATEAEQKRGGSTIAWARDRGKPTPSRSCITFFEERGQWRQNADRTFTGHALFPVPMNISTSDSEEFGEWFAGAVAERCDFLDDEPIWCLIGLTLKGIKSGKRDRYDRILGKVGAVTQWYRMCMLADLPPKWGGPAVGSCSTSKTWPGLTIAVRQGIAPNIMNKGYEILGVTVFGHFGPVKPPNIID